MPSAVSWSMNWRSEADRNVCWLQYFALKQWSHRLRQLSVLVLFPFQTNLTQLLECRWAPWFPCQFFSHLLASLKPGSLLLIWIDESCLNYSLCLLCYTHLKKIRYKASSQKIFLLHKCGSGGTSSFNVPVWRENFESYWLQIQDCRDLAVEGRKARKEKFKRKRNTRFRTCSLKKIIFSVCNFNGIIIAESHHCNNKQM